MISEIPLQLNPVSESRNSSISQRKLPQTHRLVALRTKTELQSCLETTEAFIVEIPSKSANKTLRAADEAIREQPNKYLHHLRRFVKPEHLPSHLKYHSKLSVYTPKPDAQRPSITQISHSIKNDEEPCDEEVLGLDQLTQTLHFLICTTSSLSNESASNLIESLYPSFIDGIQPQLRTIPVPLFPPFSDEQAKAWSREFWPVIYKKNNPLGAHPNIVSRAEHEMEELAGRWMALARQAGKESSEALMGEPVGAVVVDRTSQKFPSLVAAAGDARWSDCARSGDDQSGNVMAHAAMRAIGLVARQRRDLLRQHAQEASEPDPSGHFMDIPLTHTEAEAYKRNPLAPHGYLCLGLELYITHEPCVMCAMAILHSRFERIVFGQRLPRTGGISAEINNSLGENASISQGLGYGLFWRPELSWKLLAWQLITEGWSSVELSSPETHA